MKHHIALLSFQVTVPNTLSVLFILMPWSAYYEALAGDLEFRIFKIILQIVKIRKFAILPALKIILHWHCPNSIEQNVPEVRYKSNVCPVYYRIYKI